MAVPKIGLPMGVRWLRRYRVFYLCGCVILVTQVFLAYVFFTLDAGSENAAQETLSGRGKLNIETFDDKLSVESSRRFREGYPGMDDEEEDGFWNGNSIYHKVKLPPDKPQSAQHGKNEKVPTNDGNKPSEGNKTVSAVLRVEELDFVPMCEVKSKEAISAVHRARTQHCKQVIVNTTCLIKSGELYPKSLPHRCPGRGKPKSLGCFQDNKASRLLHNFYTNLKSTNSPSNCIDLCLQSGFPFAGVQYGNECFCGSEEPPLSSRLPDSSCNMKCPSDPKLACGGYYTVNVYQTGISKLKTVQVSDEVTRDNQPPVRIVFLLTLNGRAVRQVKRLIKALFHRDHFFYIHVDARQDYLARELMSLELRLGNIRISRRRHATIWGGASLLTMLLEAMTDLVQSAWDWDFIINLSEADFPIKKNSELVNFLSANRDKNFVKSHGREAQRFIQKQGLDKSFVECEAHMWRIGDRQLPKGIIVDGGSDWLALSRPFVQYLATSTSDELLKGLSTLFKYTLLPAESFFHTAIRNSEFCGSYVDNNLHITNWRRRFGCKCQYKHIVDWCGCSPNNFKPEDWHRIQGTEGRHLFFARKFEPVVNQEVINKLDQWLYGPYPENTTALDSYWQSIYHVADLSPAPDDALVTIANSVARLASRAHLTPDCSPPIRVTIITTYKKADVYQGSLIMYEVKSKGGGKVTKIETWVKPIDHFVKNVTGKLIDLFVSTEYDQKEQLARNELRALGPFSDVYAVFKVFEAMSNISFIWIDPVGRVAEVTVASADDVTNLLGFSKPNLRLPMVPGVWEVKVVWNNTVAAGTRFLVSPLEAIDNTPINSHQAVLIHSGPGVEYPNRGGWTKLMSYSSSVLERKAYSNSKRIGKDLLQWIDSLVPQFFSVLESCTVSKGCSSTLPLCHRTNWSSLSPDPKSEIVAIDKATGRIKRW